MPKAKLRAPSRVVTVAVPVHSELHRLLVNSNLMEDRTMTAGLHAILCAYFNRPDLAWEVPLSTYHRRRNGKGAGR